MVFLRPSAGPGGMCTPPHSGAAWGLCLPAVFTVTAPLIHLSFLQCVCVAPWDCTMNSPGGWGTCSQALGGPETPGAADWQVFLVQGGFYGGCWVPGFKLSPLGTICSTHAVSCLWVADLAWPTVSGKRGPRDSPLPRLRAPCVAHKPEFSPSQQHE